MNGPLIDVTKRILKRKYGVECTEPFAGVDRFRRTTGKSVAQIDLTSMKHGTGYMLKFVGFCYDNDEKYEEEKQIRPTESANPKDLAELIDEFLTEIETNLATLVKQHRESHKKKIMNIGEAVELLENSGFTVDDDTLKEKSKLADTFIHSISNDIEKYFSGKTSKYFKYDEIEIMRQIMASVYEYAQRTCELDGRPCNLETLKQVIKDAYDSNRTGK